ncbi:unnamed protein product [Rotaria sp. Silwood2]|nr:unnamed protein product [Rotaria sp. Silwood2]CAF4315559.1 unnamed protein product [Rotaria sp. Silwood2]
MSANTPLKITTDQSLHKTDQHIEGGFLSSTAVALPQQPSTKQSGEENHTKKKKCRGNRKKQRYRRQLYNQGFDSDTVAKFVQEKFHPQLQQEQDVQLVEKHDLINGQTTSSMDNIYDPSEIETGTKRKRILLTPTPTTETRSILDKPINQLSVSQAAAKKTKTTTAEVTSILDHPFSQLSISQEDVKDTNTTTIFVHNEVNNVHNDSTNNYLENFKPHYLKVSDRIFKRMLAEAIADGPKLVQCLNTPEKLYAVRELTEFTNDFYHKDFQQKLWHEYYTISYQDQKWESKITKKFAYQNNTCRMYRPNKTYIQERQATIPKQKERIAKELNECLTKLLSNIQHWQPTLDGTLLSHAINECVLHSQKKLKEEFQYKTEMIKLDWNDHQLLMKFYELQPNEELIQIAKHIWQVTADEQKTKEQQQILEQRIYLKRLPPETNKMIDNLLDDNRTTLSNPFLDPDQRAHFASRCSKTIIQCKFNLMIVQLDEFAIITHRYNLTLTNLKEKLLNLNKQYPHIYTSLLLDVIEERRQAMIQRFIRIRQHKLKTFFDQAPTVDNN